MKKISPIYNLITELKQENHSLTNWFISICTLSRNYFLFKLSTDIKSVLGEDYKLEEAHFSIDEEYNYSQYGYTPIHYTQSYVSKTKNKYIVIHGFLNAQGEYLYSQAKELNEGKTFTGTYIDLTPVQEALLKTQIKQYIPLLEPLLTEKKAREFDLKKQSNTLDWELTSLSQDLSSTEAHQEYIKKAHEFIATIQKLNQYSEMNDGRDLLMLNMIQQIQKIDACMQRQPKEQSSHHESIPETFDSKTEVVEPHDSIEELYENAINNFIEIIKDFQECNPDSLKEKHQFASQLHEQLLIIYYFPEKLIVKKDKQKIKKALDHVNIFYKEQTDQLTKEALKGNIQAIEQLFPVCSRYITKDFYEVLVNSLVEKKWNLTQASILTICDYLNIQDDRYRNYIWHLSQEKKYFLSKEGFKGIFISIFSDSKKTFDYNEKGYEVSLLLQLVFKNKKPIFEAFLRHGAFADTWGIKPISETKISFTLLYIMLDFLSQENLEYIKILLQYQADPNKIYTKETISSQNNKNLQHLKMRCEIKSHGTKMAFTKIPNQLPTSIIERLRHFDDFALWTTLVEKSSLRNLAVAFISFYENEWLSNTPVHSLQYNIYYANNEDEFTTCLIKSYSNQSEIGLFPSYIFTPHLQPARKNLPMVRSIYKKMKLAQQELATRISNLSLDEFHEEYTSLFKNTKNSLITVKVKNLQDESFLIFYYLLTCEFLLMQYAQLSIPSKNQRTFIQKYSTELYNNIISIIHRLYNKDTAEQKLEIYKKIQDSFSKKYKISTQPVELEITNCVTTLNPTIFGPPLAKKESTLPKNFIVSHYKSAPVYKAEDFKILPPKPKR